MKLVSPFSIPPCRNSLRKMTKCHICSKQTTSTRFANCFKCKKAFHFDCLNLSPSELGLIDAKWTCGYCVNEGRLLRSGSVSSPSQRPGTSAMPGNLHPSTASSLSCDQFAALMAKLDDISNDISSIKSTQMALQADLSECRSILVKHSDDLRRHDDVLVSHSRSISEHDAKVQSCTSQVLSLAESHRGLAEAVDSAACRISAIESSRIQPSAGLSVSPNVEPSEMLERLRRSHSLLIRGVPEASPDVDVSLVSQVLDCICPDANLQRTSISRIGTSLSDRPRILKLSFNNPLIVTRILKNKRVIASMPDWRKFSITDDKTPMQAKQLQDLRAVLERRRRAGEVNLTIKYIRGVPTIVSEDSSSKN